MAELQLEIGGRHYRLACRDGGEEALGKAAALFGTYVAQLQAAHEAVPENRLLLMAALTLAGDVLQEGGAPGGQVDERALERLARRAEALAKTLETTAATA